MIARAIADYLNEQGLDPEAIGAKAALPPGRLRALLDGQGEMSIDEYLAVCAALGVDYSLFFDRAKGGATV